MTAKVLPIARKQPAAQRRQLAPNGVIGMLIFSMTELMFFAGLISAFTIAKASALVPWPPADQPRLPLEQTAVNTAALLLSGVAVFMANRAYRKDPRSAKKPLLAAMGLGAFFVCFQGGEWVALIAQGLTMQTSTHAGFFYLIVGSHGLHALAAIIVLGYIYNKLRRDDLVPSAFWTAQIFWYLVVAMWPPLYWRVYLS